MFAVTEVCCCCIYNCLVPAGAPTGRQQAWESFAEPGCTGIQDFMHGSSLVATVSSCLRFEAQVLHQLLKEDESITKEVVSTPAHMRF